MARFTRTLTSLAFLAPLCLGTWSCSSTPEEPELDPSGLRARGLTPRAFPAAFQKESILVAKRISIEGPKDLLEHLAVRSDNRLFASSVETTEKGLLQRIRRRPGALGVDVRCQLDGWQIAALDEMVILQRPGEVPVSIVADGEAAYIPSDGEERREPRLQFRFQR